MDRVRKQLYITETTPRGKGVRIAVIDSGIDLTHPDLQNVVDQDASVSFSLSSDLTDRFYHGTHISGIIAGSGAASQGRYRGIAPEARLIIYKALAQDGSLAGNSARAIQAAIEAKVDIINFSASYSPYHRIGPPPWVWSETRSLTEDAFQEAADRGILCVVAAGNDGPADGSINRPGGLSSVLTVGALDKTGKEVWRRSSRGPYRMMSAIRKGGERRFDSILDTHTIQIRKPDLVAPGEDIIAPRAKDGVIVVESMFADPLDLECPYIKVSGTSQATAVVTGMAAVLLSLARAKAIPLGPNPGLALKNILVNSARPLTSKPPDDYATGNGLPIWRVVAGTLSDFEKDGRFRTQVLEGRQLRLLE
jgi:subtilisin family serine protease